MISSLFYNVAWAQQTSPAAQPNPFMQFLPLILLGLIMYFFLIRPVMKQRKEQKNLAEGLKRGDEVWTSSGIYGIVDLVDPMTVNLKISEDTIVRILKSQISARANKGDESEQKAK